MTGDLIRCDADGCSSEIKIGFNVDAMRADAIARREGWNVRVGSQRSYHHCPSHRHEEQPT